MEKVRARALAGRPLRRIVRNCTPQGSGRPGPIAIGLKEGPSAEVIG